MLGMGTATLHHQTGAPSRQSFPQCSAAEEAITASFPHNIKHLDATVVLICSYINTIALKTVRHWLVSHISTEQSLASALHQKTVGPEVWTTDVSFWFADAADRFWLARSSVLVSVPLLPHVCVFVTLDVSSNRQEAREVRLQGNSSPVHFKDFWQQRAAKCANCNITGGRQKY